MKRVPILQIVALVFVVLAAALGWWFGRGPAPSVAPKATPPAEVKQPVQEATLNTITLTPAAEKRLGILTAPVQRRKIGRERTLGGEIVIPPGRSLIVAAPVAGILKAPATGVPAAGQRLKKGTVVFSLLPLLTPEGRTTLATALVEAEGQVKSTQEQVDAGRIALKRAQQLFRDKAGSQRTVDEAQAQFNIATKNNEAALARQKLLTRTLGDADTGTFTPLSITAPAGGLLRTLSGEAGTLVPSGAALFEVLDPDQVWVRVPVYVGDLAVVQTDAVVTVGSLSGRAAQTRSARPVTAPPSANALAATADLFFEMDNKDGAFRPGQRVGVALPLLEEAESLVAPCSTVLYDIHGNTWVYENTAARTYVRRRVLLRYVTGDLAVLDRGPRPGSRLVTEGAAELFGTEMGFAK